MKRTSIIISLAITLLGLNACSGQNDNYNNYDSYYGGMDKEIYEDQYDNGQQVYNNNTRNMNNGQLEMKAMINPQTGQASGYMPLPRNWRINGSKITGPGNVEIQEYTFQKFDRNMRPVMSARQIANHIFAPEMKQSGGTITKIYAMPDIMRKDEQNSNQFYTEGGMRKSFDAVGIDAISPEGKPFFIIIHQMNFDWGMGGMWGYFTHTMTCDKSIYGETKKATVYALVNSQADANFVNNSNRNMQLQSQRSWAAHNTRMRNNQAAFDARNRATVQSNNDVSDIYMDMYRNNSASSDRMQDMTVRGIHETEVVRDPYYGQQYEVQSGSKRYFMNGSGEYYGTDDLFYQPGSDLNNNGEFQEAPRRGN